jgi:hypothetical protein
MRASGKLRRRDGDRREKITPGLRMRQVSAPGPLCALAASAHQASSPPAKWLTRECLHACPLIGMSGKPACRPVKSRTHGESAAGGRVFDPDGCRAAQSTDTAALRRLRAGRAPRPKRDRCPPPGRDVASGVPGALPRRPVSAAGTVSRVIFCPVDALKSLACGRAGSGWCATGGEPRP